MDKCFVRTCNVAQNLYGLNVCLAWRLVAEFERFNAAFRKRVNFEFKSLKEGGIPHIQVASCHVEKVIGPVLNMRYDRNSSSAKKLSSEQYI